MKTQATSRGYAHLAHSLAPLADSTLHADAVRFAGREREDTTELLGRLAEIEERRLYAKLGFPSMQAYCVEELRLSPEAAHWRVRAARVARRIPELFDAVADGRLHLTAVVLLNPYLTPGNASELIAVTAHRSKSEIELLLAERFATSTGDLLKGAADSGSDANFVLLATQDSTQVVANNGEDLGSDPGSVGVPVSSGPHASAPLPSYSRLKSLGSGLYSLQVTIDQATHDLLRRAQDLTGHSHPSGDVAAVLGRALAVLVERAERRKLGMTKKPRAPRETTSTNPRLISAAVRRAVYERDGHRCTFAAENGRRCSATRLLELDHIVPVARGGKSDVSNLRVRCLAHNQFEADRAFGAGFMKARREKGAPVAAGKAALRIAAPAESPVQASNPPRVVADPIGSDARDTLDLIQGLRSLGFRVDEARDAERYSRSLPGVTLEARMKAALRFLAPASRSFVA